METTIRNLGQTILLRMQEHKDVRSPYETGLWYDIARFVNPRREGIHPEDTSLLKGRRRGKDIYDGTPLGALNTWADGMQGFLVSESLNWFRSEMDNPILNEIDDVREWLQEYDRCLYPAFRRSNFYSILGEWFRDAGSIGTATNYTEENIEENCAVHTVIHPREIFIAESKFGEVDTVFREFELTAHQAVQKFEEAKLSQTIKDNAREHPQKKHKFIHAVFPNDDRWLGKLTAQGKKFRSVYVEVDAVKGEDDGVVRNSGYDINPYAVWRFRKNSDEVYGYSPAADAIVETFSLNQIGKDMLDASHMSVAPPFNIPEEMRGNVRITPRGYNYYEDPQRIITPVVTGINYPIGVDQQERLQKSIEDKYRVRFFLMLDRAEREMTATEIMERKSEMAVLMGPQQDRLFTEGLNKIFNIVSDIEDRAGRLPSPPDIVYEYGGNINIKLTGPLAQAQKRLFKIQPIRDAINELAPMATVFPEVLDRVNAGEMAEEILEATGFPQKLIRTDEEVAEIQRIRIEKENAEKMLQIAGAATEAVPKLSKKVEEGSVLEKIGI